MSSQTILVFGATGKQGGAAIDALLAAESPVSFKIYAVTRDPESSSAKTLAEKHSSIFILKGDIEDSAAVFKQIGQPVDGVFAITVPDMKNENSDIEVRQGKAAIDAAVGYGVKHFVYSSVDRGGDKSDNDPTYVPHFRTKHEVEEHLKATALNWTILRPVAFMDNMLPGFFGKVFGNCWSQMGDAKLQLIASEDIGVFAAKALVDPEGFRRKSISLAGDELSFAEGNEIYKKVYGTDMPTTFGVVASAIKWMVRDMGLMFKWFVEVGYGADIAQCREIYPQIQNLETWLKRQKERETEG